MENQIQVAARLRILRQVGTARWVPRPAAIHGLDLDHIRVEGTVALAKMQVSAVGAEKSQASELKSTSIFNETKMYQNIQICFVEGWSCGI